MVRVVIGRRVDQGRYMGEGLVRIGIGRWVGQGRYRKKGRSG